MIRQFLETHFLVYIAKCLIGLAITYTIYLAFPQHQFFWSVVSVLLAISPDENNAKQVAYDRMKANVLGAMVGMLIFLIHIPNLFLISLGVLLTIILATALRIQSTTRSALAAVIIVMIHEQGNPSWTVALERMGCVITGCLIALLLTLLFDFLIYKDKRRREMTVMKLMLNKYLKNKEKTN